MTAHQLSTRRDFVAQVATAAAAIAATACATSPAGAAAAAAVPKPAAPAPAPRSPEPHWDDSWATRVSQAKHKAVFDAPSIAEGVAFTNAFVFMLTYHQMYGTSDADTVAVVVIRHEAIPMAADDWFWDRYEVGRFAKLKDRATGKWARRNPFFHADPRDKEAFAPATIEKLAERGVIFLGCNLAANYMAGALAKKAGAAQQQVMADLQAHLIPRLTLMPSGILATIRAQEAGAAFVRST